MFGLLNYLSYSVRSIMLTIIKQVIIKHNLRVDSQISGYLRIHHDPKCALRPCSVLLLEKKCLATIVSLEANTIYPKSCVTNMKFLIT